MVAMKSDLQEEKQQHDITPLEFCRTHTIPPPQMYSVNTAATPSRDVFIKLATMATYPSVHTHTPTSKFSWSESRFMVKVMFILLCVCVCCSHLRLRCMCTCNRCTFCLSQTFLNSELLHAVKAKLYTLVFSRFLSSRSSSPFIFTFTVNPLLPGSSLFLSPVFSSVNPQYSWNATVHHETSSQFDSQQMILVITTIYFNDESLGSDSVPAVTSVSFRRIHFSLIFNRWFRLLPPSASIMNL